MKTTVHRASRVWLVTCLFSLGLLSGSLGYAPPLTQAKPHATATGPTLTLDVNANRHPISPYIYGMNGAVEGLAGELQLPVNRWGGNLTTRYNWQLNVFNHSRDYFFENYPEDNTTSSDHFVEQNQRTGTTSLIAIPMIGWTPKDRLIRCGFSVAKYGPQQVVNDAQGQTDCGNGRRLDNSYILNADPTDTSIAVGPQFQKDWIAHLIANYGSAQNGGVKLYSLDNEPMLWSYQDWDVHPAHLGYDELYSRTIQYAPAIKQADPTAQTLGPSEWGWWAYFYSAIDYSTANFPSTHPDQDAHGGKPLAEWYLQKMKTYEQLNGQRILDYLDEHYYPNNDGIPLSPAGNATTQALRLRSTRSLWDTTYLDETPYLNTVAIRLIPRMQEWIANNYPGTKTAISEYNFGGLEDINGALTQADVLGIFGREKLDLATIWEPPAANQPGAYAFRMYLNYDGTGKTFGDTGVQAASSDQSQLSIYAAQRTSDEAVTLMIVNKSPDTDLTSSLNMSGFGPDANAQVYRYSAANLTQIVRQADQPLTQTGFTATYPAYSITLVVLPKTRLAAPTGLSATAAGNAVNLNWNPLAANQTGFQLERRTGANGTWQILQGNLAANASQYSDTTVTTGTLYYYRLRAYNGTGGQSAYSNEVSLFAPSSVVVTNSNASGAGSLAQALAQAQSGAVKVVTFELPGNSLTVSTALTVPSGVTLGGGCGATGPTITLQGQGASSPPLTLTTGNVLYGLKITGFSGPQLRIPKGNHRLNCVVVR